MKKIEYQGQTIQQQLNQTQDLSKATGAPVNIPNSERIIKDTISTQTTTTPPAVTYNNQPAVVGATSRTSELPRDYSYLLDDDGIKKAINNPGSSISSTFSDEDLEEIIACSPYTNGLRNQTEVLKWYLKNNPRKIERMLKVFCSYNTDEQLQNDPYLKETFNLSISSPRKVFYRVKGKGRPATDTISLPEPRKDFNNLPYKQQASKRFVWGIKNAYLAFVNHNFELGKEILDSYFRQASGYLRIISTDSKQQFSHIMVNYLITIDKLVQPEYKSKLIMSNQEHFLKDNGAALLAISQLVQNNLFDDAFSLYKIFEKEHNISVLDKEQKAMLAQSCELMAAGILRKQGDFFPLKEYDTNHKKYVVFTLLKTAYENYYKTRPYEMGGSLLKYIFNYSKEYDKDYCNNFIESLPRPLSNLLKADGVITTNITKSHIQGINKNNIPKEFHDLLKLATFFAGQNEYIEKGLDKKQDNFYEQLIELEKECGFETLIDISAIYGRTDVMLKLFERILPEQIWNDSKLSRQFILCQSGQALANISPQIEDLKVDDQTKSIKHYEAAIANVIEKNHEAAQKHLEKAIEGDPTNEEYIEAAMWVNSMLIENKGALDKIYSTDSSGIKQEEATDIITVPAASKNSADLLDDDSYEAIEVYPAPEEIHKQFQLIKAQKLKKDSSFKGIEDSWKLAENIKIDIKDTTYLGKYKGLEYWGVTSEKIQNRWSEHGKAFEDAMKKGFVRRNHGQNGIKPLPNKAFEIKINANLRTVTSEVFYNDNKKMLLYFDEVGNHEMVKNFVNSTKGLTFINCGTSRINEEF